jgi:Bacterial archaeo-eukaryotic release factor family 3
MGWILGKNSPTRPIGNHWLRLRTPARKLQLVKRMKESALVPPDPLPPPRATALRTLVTPRPGPVVTLYTPLLRTLPGPRAKAAAYQGAIADAEAELEQAGVSEAEAQDIRKQLAAVETDRRPFDRPVAGLAVLHDRTSLHVYGLPDEPAQSMTVAENFALRPLLAASRQNRRYYALALSTNRVALFRGDAFGLATVGAQGVPARLEQALGSERTESTLRLRGSLTGGRAPAVSYRPDSGREQRKLDVARFYRQIAQAVEAALEGRREPIVLVATQAHHSGLRAVLRLPRLLEEGVEISPDHLSPSELHARTWPLVERAIAAEEARVADDYEQSVKRGKALHRIDDVAAAAAEGRIHRLWVKPDERMPGAIDPTSGELVGGREREDVFDGLVTLVLRHGGEVMVADRIPSGHSLAAELH